jgi:hydrogenase maturation protease
VRRLFYGVRYKELGSGSWNGTRTGEHSSPPGRRAKLSMPLPIRVLCLGNELLADDAFGKAVGDELRSQLPASLEVVDTSATGFALMDYLQNTFCLLVIDSVQAGAALGTIYVLREDDIQSVPGGSPHYVGLFETLRLARELLLPIPKEVVILAVEAADTTTLGGPMHPAVQAAVPVVADAVRAITRAAATSEPDRPEALKQAIDSVVERFRRERS